MGLITYLLYFVICFSATMAGSISGIGGGVIIKPLMDLISPLSVSVISFLSGCTVLTMSLVSMLRSRNGDTAIEPGRGTALAVSGALGGVVGKLLFERLLTRWDSARVTRIQNILLLVQIVAILVYTLRKDHIHRLNIRSIPACVGFGLFLGVSASFLGIGGGPINIFVLSFFLGMEAKAAALHSLYIIFLSQLASLLMSVIRGKVPGFELPVLIVMAAGAVIGAALGRRFAKRMDDRATDKLFLGVMVLVFLICVMNLR